MERLQLRFKKSHYCSTAVLFGPIGGIICDQNDNSINQYLNVQLVILTGPPVFSDTLPKQYKHQPVSVYCQTDHATSRKTRLQTNFVFQVTPG